MGFVNGLFLFFEKKIKNNFSLNNFVKVFLTCFVVFNLWVIFRIDDFNFMVLFYSNLYSNFFYNFTLENVLLLILVIFAVLSQKIDNYNYLQKISNKFSFLILIPIFIIIIITGLAIKAGSSEKFIYFDF